MFHISSPKFNEQINQFFSETWIIISPKSIIILVKERNPNLPKNLLMNFASNLPEQPTYENGLNVKVQQTKKFIKSLMYLTKKLFML